jgi:exopolyphosphatase/guanosine-5'-triphosphate,3'-diphosphate pyrophosphatase
MASSAEGPAQARNDGTHTHYSDVFAALDLGTNNCRLLIAKPAPEERGAAANGLRVIDSFSRIVRLGEGVSVTGMLSNEAMERTIAALRQCRTKLNRHAIAGARYVATEACRRAQNSEAFLKRVKAETGIAIDIISTEEEAQLAFRGCIPLLDTKADKAIVFDIGGGSTEFLWVDTKGDAAQVIDWFSIRHGVMNLAEHFGGNAYVELYFNELVERIMREFQAFDQKHNIRNHIAQRPVQLLSTSGTVTTLAAVHMKLPRYDRMRVDGSTLPTRSLRDVVEQLVGMRPYERAAEPCIGIERSDFILSGCVIFEAIARMWQAEKITIADRGVREGIIVSLLNGKGDGQ